ncbi:xylose isomerase-like protein [Auriscalpium vulgare]|uniref:Xylose isomerase-like protein n=1 Tax=Auriscalpium vulgare TaxID=40419 RepID=A0ACB8R4R2_9AGAM|nr:xylose isomerase-like protein [Auriscalpium vulgare]
MASSELSAIELCYATSSAGMHPSHNLPLKLRAIAGSGFKLAEIAFPDLEAYAAQNHSGYQKIDNAGRGDIDLLCEVAREIEALCVELGMKVLAVHPFSEFEGYTDAKKREDGFDRAQAWFKVLAALDCQMLQVGSSDDPETSGDLDVIARDLRQLADEAAAVDPPIRIAYEMWAWGVHVNTWQHTWEVCKLVDRPNFGLCLDTFQICARAYVDPASPPNVLPSASAHLAASLENLTRSVPPEKIFYLQISDGSRKVVADTLRENAQGLPPLYAWSNAWRPLPLLDVFRGFLPVVDVVEAVWRTGWRGPWSYEVFYEADMAKHDRDVPTRWTASARESHRMIMRDLEKRGLLHGA